MSARTERLYRRDPFLTRLTARVVDLRHEPGGDPSSSARLGVLLDRTVFYPTGGGQPHDTGLLGGLPVIDVAESAEGPVHIVELRDVAGRPHGAHLTIGGTVEAAIDWPRRFDHMQQHSGQHILSRAFVETAAAATRSFHLGLAACTIDVDLAGAAESAIRAAEERANEIVWSDRVVLSREAGADDPAVRDAAGDAEDAGLPPGEPRRLVEIVGYDTNPCGGTHVTRTGQVGAVAITAWEPYKGRTRVTFLCGGRVVRALRETGDLLGRCVGALSAPPVEVPAALARVLAERDALARRANLLFETVAAAEAEKLAASAEAAGSWRVLRLSCRATERSVEEAQILIRRFTTPAARIAIVGVEDGPASTLLAGRSAGEGPSVGAVVADVARAVGGRGGGSPVFGRAGGIPSARIEESIDRTRALLLGAAPGLDG